VLVSFSSLGARTATVLDASSNPLITCPIATRTDLPVYRPTALAFIDGTTGTVSCAVQRGTVRTTETLSVSISNAQVTLGALTFSLNAARTSSSVLAGQSNIAGTLAPLLGFTDFYADQSRFSIGRTPLDNRITTLSHVTTSGDSYSCTDSRF
jgi:hypothetical protein